MWSSYKQLWHVMGTQLWIFIDCLYLKDLINTTVVHNDNTCISDIYNECTCNLFVKTWFPHSRNEIWKFQGGNRLIENLYRNKKDEWMNKLGKQHPASHCTRKFAIIVEESSLPVEFTCDKHYWNSQTSAARLVLFLIKEGYSVCKHGMVPVCGKVAVPKLEVRQARKIFVVSGTVFKRSLI